MARTLIDFEVEVDGRFFATIQAETLWQAMEKVEEREGFHWPTRPGSVIRVVWPECPNGGGISIVWE